MPLQIHVLMQETKDIDDVLPLNTGNPEYDEVPALAPVSGNVKRSETGANLRALPDPDDGGAGA